jgi:hypothetical protein
MLFAELVWGMLFVELARAVNDLVWRSGRIGNMPKVELDWPGKFVEKGRGKMGSIADEGSKAESV